MWETHKRGLNSSVVEHLLNKYKVLGSILSTTYKGNKSDVSVFYVLVHSSASKLGISLSPRGKKLRVGSSGDLWVSTETEAHPAGLSAEVPSLA